MPSEESYRIVRYLAESAAAEAPASAGTSATDNSLIAIVRDLLGCKYRDTEALHIIELLQQADEFKTPMSAGEGQAQPTDLLLKSRRDQDGNLVVYLYEAQEALKEKTQPLSEGEAMDMARALFFHVLIKGGEGNPFRSINADWFTEIAAPKVKEFCDSRAKATPPAPDLREAAEGVIRIADLIPQGMSMRVAVKKLRAALAGKGNQ